MPRPALWLRFALTAVVLLAAACSKQSVEDRAREQAEKIQKGMVDVEAVALEQKAPADVVTEVQRNLTAINEYQGEIQVRVGPISGTFGGKLTLSNERPPESLTLTVEGTGKIGFAKGAGDVTLLSRGEMATWLRYAGEVQIGGRVASVGQRLLDVVSKSMIQQGLDKLNAALKERLAKQAGMGQEEGGPLTPE